jgi:glycosyltransferase involved in cell wall biosynthesis
VSRVASGNGDVTVVVPCFNQGKFVAEAVRSALSQQGGAPRVVVVDDGSTDAETPGALEGLPPEVEVVRQENAGPAAARNAGASHSETELLLALDADDRLAPGALATLRGALDREPAAGYTYGVMRMFGAQSGEVRFPPYDPYRLLYRPIVGGPGTSLYRRSVFDEVGGFDPAVPGYEDWDLQLSVLEHGYDAAFVPEVTLEYRKHERSALSADRRRHREIFAALRRKHAALYDRAPALAASSELGPLGRLAYRTWWGWRPLPARVEQALIRARFRLG